MSEPTIPDDDRQRRLEAAMAEFLIAVDAGWRPEPEPFLARYPDLRAELAGFLADLSAMAVLVEPLLPAGAASPVLRATPEPKATLPLSAMATEGGESATDAGTTVDIASASGSGSTTHPASTCTFGEEPHAANASGTLPDGTRVRYFGDYELQRVLGEGGMGIVYKARQLSLNRTVALKMIRAARFPSADAVRRFQNEAEAVARLDHPNIVPIFEVGQFEDQHYFSMKLIAGEGLDKRLMEYVADPQRAARLVATTAGAIHHAHQRGILHRDLKPANILVDAEGKPNVTDFGLAKRVEGDSELTQSGAILGTPAYMAPEQASAKRGAVTTATDVYGLGAILYALLTGRGPFGGATVPETLDQVREQVPQPPRSLNPRVPRDLEVICLKCLEKDPQRRYASADSLAEDLKRWLAGEPIAARPVGNAARLWMWCRRNPALAGAAGLAAAALVVVAVLSLLYADRQGRHAAEQAKATTKITRLAQNLEGESKALRSSLSESSRRLAVLNFERGQAAFERGEIGPGLLWMVETLRNATDAGDAAWKHVALANLAAWQPLYPSLRGVFSHDGVYVATFSPDGKTVLTGGGDKMARLWDAASGQPTGKPLEHQGNVSAVAFSPDGKTILTASDQTARLWDATSGRPLGQPMAHSEWIRAVAFSPDGKTILTGSSDRTARLWDAATGQPIAKPLKHRDEVLAVAFSPDGKTILTGSADRAARLWDATPGRPIGQPLQHQAPVWTVAFSPDGKTVLTGSFDKTARLWDAATGQPTGQPLEHQGYVTAVAFSPDGNTVLTGSSDKTARLWDAATGQPTGQPLEHQGNVGAVAFSPDGKNVLTGSGDKTARLWDAATGLPIGQPLEHRDAVYAVAFSPDGKTILTGGNDSTARLWDIPVGQPVGQPLDHQDVVRAVVFSPDGRTILTGGRDKTARLWDAATRLPTGRPLEHRDQVSAVAFSPDGKTVLAGSWDKTARLWNAATGQPVGKSLDHQGSVKAVAFSPDGKTVLTGGWDKTARLWDAATGQPIGQPLLHQGSGVAVAFSPDGKTILTGSGDRTARLWHAASGQPIGKPMVHQGDVAAVAFSPDGKTVLTGSSDKAARLWHATGRPIGRSLEHRGWVYAVAFSPYGETVLTGSEDKTARLWDTATGMPIGKPMEHESSVTSVAFSPDGKTILTGSYDTTARLWDVPGVLPDDVSRLGAWIETLTGLELDERGSLRVLDTAVWRQRRERLTELGGPPPSGAARLFDPILFGHAPTARADSRMKLGRWDEAEAACTDAIRARPLNRSVWSARGRFYISRVRPEQAAQSFAAAIRRMPDDIALREQHFLAVSGTGDSNGSKNALSDMVDRFGAIDDPDKASSVAWTCALLPNAVSEVEVPIRLAQAAVKGASRHHMADSLTTLGATLYRARRFDDAIRRLDEGILLPRPGKLPQAWAFLAMAHHRLGHGAEARRWLDRLREYQPSTDPDRFWNELEIRLLRSEAEAVVLYDPNFPANPFAH